MNSSGRGRKAAGGIEVVPPGGGADPAFGPAFGPAFVPAFGLAVDPAAGVPPGEVAVGELQEAAPSTRATPTAVIPSNVRRRRMATSVTAPVPPGATPTRRGDRPLTNLRTHGDRDDVPAPPLRPMTIRHLPNTTAAGDVAAVLADDGCVVVDRLVDKSLLDRVRGELQPYLDASPVGVDDFSGRNTRRTGALVARSVAARELITHPLVLDTVAAVLADSTNFQLHLTQMIAIGPGEPAQPIHRDQWAFDFFTFPLGFEVQCNTIWAITDFTEANGATRVIPGSHRFEDKLSFTGADTEAAEMDAGSAFFYTGAIYHGGGANRSDEVRYGCNITYNRAWLRQEENQYLSVPIEIARELPEQFQQLIGYARGAYALGYVDDLRDPIEVLRPGGGAIGFGAAAAD